MKRYGILLIASLTGFQVCFGGGFSADAVGTAGAQSLSMGAGVRAAALGGAYSAVSDDASAVYWNPAGLTQLPDVSLMFMHTDYLADIGFDHFAFGYARENYTLGAALSCMNAGDISRTDAGGGSLGVYNPMDYVGIVSLAVKMDSYSSMRDGRDFFSIGMSAKVLASRIIEKASTYAVDAGILGRSSLGFHGRSIKYGMVAQNLGPKLKYDQDGDPLPFTVRAGLALETGKNLLLSGDVVFPRANQPYVALGAEYKIRVLDKTGVSLRLGGNTRTINGLGGLAGLSAGLGVRFGFIFIDYASTSFGELGGSQKISLAFSFGGEEEPEYDYRKKRGSRRAAAGKSSTESAWKRASSGDAPAWN